MKIKSKEQKNPIERMGVFSDITERKRAENELLYYAEVVKNMAEGVYLVGAEDGIIRYANPKFEKMFGYNPGEMIGKHVSIVNAPTDKDPRETSRQIMEVLKKTCEWHGEVNNIKKDGTLFWSSAHVSVLDHPKYGKVLVAVHHDITARKQAEEEREKLQAQLVQAQKMESVGRLAGGVAHDFNNILGVIFGYTERALKQVAPTKPLHADLQKILKAAKRSADIIRQLLTFARKQTVAPKVLDLNANVEGMLNMLRRLIGEDINLAWRPGKELWPVKIDPSQIDQVLANLCVNARDAIAGVGKVTLETGNTTFDEAYCVEHADAVPGEYVQLAVSDNGCGMDKETLTNIFEPFFTTKGIGEGTGLGLATVYGIVKQNHGYIHVHSEPGHGMSFKIYLPRHAGKVEQIRQEGPEEPPARGHATILLVEDEPAFLKIIAGILTGLGYTVLAAGTPGEAIRLSKEHTGKIHLLITDVVMPEMNGGDLVKKLMSLYPDLKHLFMSGYTANVIAHRGVLEEGVNFIQKPFSIKDLAAKDRAVLDNANT